MLTKKLAVGYGNMAAKADAIQHPQPYLHPCYIHMEVLGKHSRIC